MPGKRKQGGKKSKAGRWVKKASNKNYPARRLRNKVKRVFRSNGPDAALAYVKQHGGNDTLNKLKRRNSVKGAIKRAEEELRNAKS